MGCSPAQGEKIKMANGQMEEGSIQPSPDSGWIALGGGFYPPKYLATASARERTWSFS
jgi:hypothetical protein